MNLFEINREILNTGNLYNEKKQISKKLIQIDNLLISETIKLDELALVLQKENQDVTDLEGFSLKSLWLDLFNKKYEHLIKEQQEAYQAKLNFEFAENNVKKLSLEKKKHEAILSDFEEIEQKFKSLVKTKVIFLENENNPVFNQIGRLNLEVLNQNKLLKEYNEAIVVGKKVLNLTANVREELEEAINYGKWDKIGGGYMATRLKRDKMKKTYQLVKKLNLELICFNAELNDIKLAYKNLIKFNLSWNFADYFFDNIFVDRTIQNRLEQANEDLATLHDEIHELYLKLITEHKNQYLILEKNIENYEKFVAEA